MAHEVSSLVVVDGSFESMKIEVHVSVIVVSMRGSLVISMVDVLIVSITDCCVWSDGTGVEGET